MTLANMAHVGKILFKTERGLFQWRIVIAQSIEYSKARNVTKNIEHKEILRGRKEEGDINFMKNRAGNITQSATHLAGLNAADIPITLGPKPTAKKIV